MKNKRGDIFVFADWKGMQGPFLMGTLHSELLRGKEIFSFEYDRGWLQSDIAQLLDPDLQLVSGSQYLNEKNKSNFGLFLDSSPDRWGRMLIQRREAALAKMERRNVRTLFETDHLLGVYDDYRMGALRFKTEKNGPFLNHNKELAVPPWTFIRELEQISLRLEEDDVTDNPHYLKWLNMLMAPGSSLGGARPKAGVIDARNHLWIAKFPGRSDRADVGGWEMAVNELARNAGITAAEAMAQKFSCRHHTFLTKRFDRHDKGERIHFASAMTMLGYTDGQDGASYLELAKFIMVNGAKVNEDMKELWKRIVFNICVSNTDDHLRNHGFILSPKGWILAPAFDMNPIENGNGLSINISESDNSLDLELAMDVHQYFRLNNKEAKGILKKIKTAVSHWREIAKKYGISKSEQENKAPAFSRAS